MILRKPYAFLIKYFRIIHIIMFVLFVYLVFLLRPITIFFREYLTNNSNLYFENMASRYVPVILFIIVLVIMVLSFGIYFLMRKKDKPVLFYKVVIIYTVILFIVTIYFYFFFKSLSTTNYNNLRIVANRDIILILYYTNFVLVGFSFIRAFGFDIKKFSFEKDRKELQLEAGDREEYEVNINVEKEDIVDYLNRQKREFKYYFKENSKFFIIISLITFIFLGAYFSYDYFVINRVYKENQDILINKVLYKVNSSFITTRDKYGKDINEENEFLIAYLHIENRNKKMILDDQQFRVNVDDLYYYPAVGYCNSFDDLGACYNPTLNLGEQDYVLIFKIPKKHSKIGFEILKNKNNYKYTKVNLLYNNDYREIVNYNMNDKITIDNNEYQISDYKITDKTSYTYESCIDDKCNNFTRIIKGKLGNNVLILTMANNDKLSSDYLDNYLGLKYRNITLFGADVELIDRYKDTIYLGIPSQITEKDELILTINARDIEYDILLKGEKNE